MKEKTRTQHKYSTVKLKKTLHFTTAIAFFLQQLVPYSSAFAMEAPEEERNFSVVRALPASSPQLLQSPQSSQSLPLPDELMSAQQTLQELIFESTHARPDLFTPLLAEIRQELETAPPEVRELIKNKLPNLLEGSLSLLPSTLLRLKDRIPFDSTLAPNHAAFKRLQEVMGFLEGFQQNSLLISSPLKGKLQKLQGYYQEYMNLLCRIDPPERLPYLSAIPFATEFLESPQVISKEIAYDLLSLNEYGLITKSNDTGSSPVAKVGQVYVKKNFTKSRVSSSFNTSPDSSVQEGTLNPAMEWAMSAFHRLLFGDGLVRSSLVLLPSVPHKDPIPGTEGERLIQEASDPNISKRDRESIINRLHEEEELQRDFRSTTKSYMAQATEEAKGEFLSVFLEHAFQDPSLFKSLDHSQVQGVILSSFLLAFGDAKGDNFMVTFPDAQGKRKIISIDNDWALESFVLEAEPGFHILGARNLLFFISEFMNQSLTPQVRERFLSYSPGVFLLRWLRALRHHNERYEALRKVHPTLKDADPHQSPHLKLRPGTSKELLERFTHLQHVLRLNPEVKLQDLFASLSPLAALYCQDLVAQETDPLEAFDKAYNRNALFENYNRPAFFEDDHNKKASFEDVLAHKLSQAHKGVTFRETLRKETTPLHAYKERTHSIEEIAEEVLNSIDFQALTPREGLQALEEAVSSFPDIIKGAIQKNESLVGSFTPLLQNSMPLFLVKLFIETVPELLMQTDEQGYSLLHRAIEAHVPENIITYFLEKGMDPDLPTLRKSPFYSLSPLDMACISYEPHLPSAFTALINAGEKLVTPQLALQFYKKLMSSFQSSKGDVPSPSETLLSSFLTLLERNQQLAWEFSLFHLLPEADKKPGDVVVRTPDSKTRVLSPHLQKQFFDKDWKIIRRNKEGKRDVGIIERHIHGVPLRFYIKEYPELPGLEEAVGSFMRRLFGFGAPYMELVRIGNIPYLVSQEIQGKTAAEVLKETPQFFDASDFLDPYYTSALILMNMLINPEDGIFPNYIVEKLPRTQAHRLISIDNDHAFVPGVVKGQKQGRDPIVQVKTILFGLDHMLKPIHPQVRAQFLKVDIGEFLEGWLRDSRQRNALYGELFTQQERLALLPKKPDDPTSKGTYIGIPFQDNAIKDLYQKMSALQSLLKESPQLTHLELLSKVEPHVGHRYGKGFIPAGKNFKERIQFVDGVNSHLSMTTSGRLFKTMNVPLKESLIETGTKDVTKAQDYRPNRALEELKEIRRQHAGLVLFDSQRSRGGSSLPASTPTLNLSHLKTLRLEEHLEKALAQRSFKDITETDQRALFELMRERKFKHLILRDAYALQDWVFQGIQLEYLLTLNLEGCLALTDEAIPLIAGKALSLESLNLGRISTKMKEIGRERKSRTDRSPLYIFFPSLRYLNISYGGVKTVLVDAPKLEIFKARAAKDLQALDIRQQSAVSLEMTSSNLRKVDLREVQSLSLQAFLQFLKTHSNLSEVQTEKARNLPTIPRIPFQDIRVPLERENLERFNVLYPRATDSSDSEAQLQLGEMYANSQGVKQNIDKAMEWYQRAFPRIPFEDIPPPFNRKTLKKLNELYKDAMEGNDPEAQFQLGEMYASGQGVKQNMERAREWYEKAIQNDHPIGKKVLELIEDQKNKEELDFEYKDLTSVEMRFVMVFLKDRPLKKLNLWGNKIGVEGARFLGKGLRGNTTLQSLDLWDNKIGAEGARFLSEFLRSNTSLQGLRLSKNNIGAEGARYLSEAPRDNTALQTLNLQDNNIRAEGARYLSEVLRDNTTLQTLNLQDNNIGAEGARFLSEALRDNTTLQTLNLRDNNIGAEGARFLSEALRDNTTLQTLNLQDNNIGDEGTHFLSEGLSGNTSLQELGLCSNNIGAEGARFLSEALRDNTTLQTLELGGNKIGTEGIRFLSEGLRDNTTLQGLHLGGNSIGAEGAILLSEGLRGNTSIKSLGFGHNNIETGGTKVLSEILKDNTTLQSLDLWHNNIGDEGARFLSVGLRGNTSLQKLALSENKIGTEGTRFLSEGLRDNTSLQLLYLRDNNIGDKGVQALSEGLRDNKFLRELDLGTNNIGVEGARFLSEFLRSNTTLQSLDLWDNKIGAEGARFLSEFLRSNTSLQRLVLSDNSIGDEGAKALSEFLRGNTSLQELDLKINNIGDEGKRLLDELKEKSPQMEIKY